MRLDSSYPPLAEHKRSPAHMMPVLHIGRSGLLTHRQNSNGQPKGLPISHEGA